MTLKCSDTSRITRNTSILLIVIAIALAFTPIVGAESIISKDRTWEIYPQLIHNNIPIASVSDEKPSPIEMISIVLPQSMLHYSKENFNITVIDIAIPEKDLESARNNSDSSSYLILPGIEENENVAILTIPKNMFDYLSGDQDVIKLKFAEYYFKFYPSLSKISTLQTEIIKNSNKNNNDSNLLLSEESTKYIPQGYELNTTRTYWVSYVNRSITYITGKIQPYGYYHSGEGYDAIQEKEIYCAPHGYWHGDAVELALEYFDSGGDYNLKIIPVIYNENPNYSITPGNNGFSGVNITVPSNYLGYQDFSHSYDYYVGIGVIPYDLGDIEIWIYDIYGDQWFYYYYYDSTPSFMIDQIYSSSETYWLKNPGSYTYICNVSPFFDDWNWEDGDWSRPGENFFNDLGTSSENEYLTEEFFVGNYVDDYLLQDNTIWTVIENCGTTL